jgi:hypothetical protein
MALSDWKKVKDQKFGNNIMVIYVKKNIAVELYKDSYCGKTDNMNVIIRDKNLKSHMSVYGKDIHIEYCSTEKQARDYAEDYMKRH